MSDVSHRIALILELTDAKLRDGIKAVNRVLGDLERGAKTTSDRAGAAMEGFESRTKAALGQIGGSTGAAAKAIGGLESKAKTAAAGAAGAVEGFEKRTKNALGRIGNSTSGVGRLFGSLRDDTEKAVEDAGDAVEGFGRRTSSTLDRLLGPLADFKGQIAAAMGVAGLGAAVSNAADFERALADVATLLDGTGVSLQRYKEQLLDLAGRSSRDVLDLTKGLYDALSSGIPAIEGASGAFAVLEASAKAAAAGNAETADVIRTVTAVLNAYKGSGLTAAEVTDKLRVAVDKGVTTMPELASSLGQILSVSSGFKISFDEVLAVITQLTLAGFSTGEAITGLRQALVSTANAEKQTSIAKTMEAIGFSMNLAKLESQGFIGTLEEMRQTTGATSDVINNLYTDIDGKKAVLALAAQGFDSLRANLDAVKNASGATDRAAKIVSASFDEQWKVLKNRLTVALITIGERALPALARGMEHLSQLLDGGGVVDGLGAMAAAVANLAAFVASHGQAIVVFLTTVAAFKIGAAAMAGITNLKTALMGLASTGKTVAQTAARFGQDYALNYGSGVSRGLAGASTGIAAGLKKALKNPNILAMVAAIGVELGQAFGDWIGKGLADADADVGTAAQARIKASTEEMRRSMERLALSAGFRSADELREVQDKLSKGQALLLKGQNRVLNPNTPDAVLGFKAEDVKDLSEAFKSSASDAQAATSEAQATFAAQIGNLENRKAQLDAQMASMRAAQAELQEKAAQFNRDANNTLEGFGKALVEGNQPARDSAKAIESLKELEAEALDVSRRLIDAKRSQAEFANGVAQSEQEAAQAADDAAESVRARTKEKKAEETAAREAARAARREAEQARREREREAADAIRDLGRLQADAMQAEGQAGLDFLQSAIDAQEQAIAEAKTLNEQTLQGMEKAGQSVEDMAIEEQRGLLRVQSLLREQIGLIEALRVKREKAAEESATREMNIAREAAAERAKYLSPDAQRQQQEELGRLQTATELQTAAEITKIRSESAKSVAELEDRLREQRAAADLAFQRQIAEGTKRAVGATGFKEAGDEPPPPKAAAALRGLIGTIWTSLVEGGQDVVEGLGERIAKSASYAADKLSETSAYKLVAGYAEKAADLIASGGKAAADWLQTGAEKATDGLLRGAQFVLGDSLFSRITSVVGQISDATGTVLKAVGGQIVAAGQAAALIPEKLAAASEELVTGLTGALGAIGDNAAERLGDALTGFTTGISDALTAPLKELLGEDLSKYLSPILDLPANLMRQINGKLLQPALAAATAPFDRLLGGVGEALSALTDPNNTKAALKDRLAEVDAETAKRVQELTAAGRPDEAAKARAEGASQKAEIQREFDKNQPEAVLKRVVDQATEILKRVVESLPALVGKLVDTLITEAPKFIAGIADAIAGILTTLAPKIGPLLTALLNAVLDAVPVIIDALVQAVPQIVDGLLKALIGLIGRLPALLTTILQGIIDLLPGLFQALADNLPALIIALVDAVPQIIMALVDALPQILTALIEGAGEIVGALIEHLPEIIVAIVRALPQIIWALLKLVPLLVWAVAKGLGLAVARIGIGLGRAGAKLGEWAVMAGKTVYNYLTAAGKWVWKVLTSVGRGAKKAGSWLYDNTIGAIFHSGGHVRRGADPATAVRWAAAGAQRFAAGGFPGAIEASMRRQLHGDEVPILAQVGEAVLNRRAVANMGQAEINARNAGAVPVAAAGPVVAQITPDSRGLDALLRMLIGQIVLTAAQPGTPMNRVLDRRAVPGAKGVR